LELPPEDAVVVGCGSPLPARVDTEPPVLGGGGVGVPVLLGVLARRALEEDECW